MIAGGAIDLTVKRINQFNEEVLLDLDLDEGVVPGKIRDHGVGVARYRGAPWQDCDFLLERLCSWLSGPDFHPEDESWKVPFALERQRRLVLELSKRFEPVPCRDSNQSRVESFRS